MTSPATLFARSFIGALVARGVTDVVVSPGSRSQALALAAAEAEQSGHLTLHVVVDERSAGFRALGIALETGLPAVALATSGSAPAHFLPAVMEAHHAGVPFIVVSADRPESLKGVGANQTTQHSGLFGFAASTIDAVAEANTAEGAGIAAALEVFDQAAAGGAAHANVEFSEPLSSSEPSEFVLPHPVGAATDSGGDGFPGAGAGGWDPRHRRARGGKPGRTVGARVGGSVDRGSREWRPVWPAPSSLLPGGPERRASPDPTAAHHHRGKTYPLAGSVGAAH